MSFLTEWRYQLVLKENTKLIQRDSNKVLANYIDIREESLSRIKKQERRF